MLQLLDMTQLCFLRVYHNKVSKMGYVRVEMKFNFITLSLERVSPQRAER